MKNLNKLLTRIQLHLQVEFSIDFNRLKENSNIPRKELPERLQVSESAIQKHIVFLKEQGIITREGGNKYGKWKVIE